MPDGIVFDAEFYASSYPDVVAVIGNSQEMLYLHYTTHGKNEGRLPYAGATAGTSNTLTQMPASNTVTVAPSLLTEETAYLIDSYARSLGYYEYYQRSNISYTGGYLSVVLITPKNTMGLVFVLYPELGEWRASASPMAGRPSILTANIEDVEAWYEEHTIVKMCYSLADIKDFIDYFAAY